MALTGERNWTIRPAAPEDGPAISAVLTAAGTAAWSEFLGAERIERATRGAEQPADLVALDERGVFAFVAWDASTGEITRLSTDPRGWGLGAGEALLERALGALRGAGRRQAGSTRGAQRPRLGLLREARLATGR